MEASFSLVADKPIHFKEGDYFKMAVNGLEGSEGLDLYNYNGVFLKDKEIAGLGRNIEYNLNDLVGGLGVTEAKESEKVVIDDDTENINLKLETNCILDPGLFAHLISLKVISDGKEKIIPFGVPGIKLDWENRGIYIYQISKDLIQ